MNLTTEQVLATMLDEFRDRLIIWVRLEDQVDQLVKVESVAINGSTVQLETEVIMQPETEGGDV